MHYTPPMSEPAPGPKLHPDLVRADTAGFANLAFGLICFAFAAGFGWAGRLMCAALWKDLVTGAARREWDLLSWIVGPVMGLIFVAIMLLLVVGGFAFVFGWISSLSGKLSAEELAWRRRATSVEATSTARPGSLRVFKITDGLGVHSAGPRFSFPVELAAIEGEADLSAFRNLAVSQVAEYGDHLYSRKPSELSKSESLLNQLIGRHRDRSELRPTTERGRSIEVVTLPASFKVDPTTPPEVVVVEVDCTRIWCSVARGSRVREPDGDQQP